MFIRYHHVEQTVEYHKRLFSTKLILQYSPKTSSNPIDFLSSEPLWCLLLGLKNKSSLYHSMAVLAKGYNYINTILSDASSVRWEDGKVKNSLTSKRTKQQSCLKMKITHGDDSWVCVFPHYADSLCAAVFALCWRCVWVRQPTQTEQQEKASPEYI